MTSGGAYEESREVIDLISRAWREGRTIVPLLGAGISAESGMPVVDDIIRYLAMLKLYIDNVVHRPDKSGMFNGIDKEYSRHPIRFVHDYGWPDRFQLRQELYQWFHDHPEEGSEYGAWIDEARDVFVAKSKPWHVERYKELLKTVATRKEKEGDSKAPKSVWKMLGDWRVVIRKFTDFNPDVADSLFERLYRGREPGRCHQFWAFLTRLMGLRLFLTINFDPFLERALRDQNIDRRVFGVEHGEVLPDASLVRESVAILKLHGDTHHLLLDERLDYPPSDPYLRRLDGCMPRDPLLVVMGCGTGDPRILKIVERLAEKHGKSGKPGAIWLHYEDFVREREPKPLEELNDRIHHARVTNPGLFLSHLYAYLNDLHPASRVPYPTHIPQPIGLHLADPGADSDPKTVFVACYKKVDCNNKLDETVVLFSSLENHSRPLGAISASSRLAEFVYEKSLRGYTPIWVNLECYEARPMMGFEAA